jgi:hypothetical protein
MAYGLIITILEYLIATVLGFLRAGSPTSVSYRLSWTAYTGSLDWLSFYLNL